MPGRAPSGFPGAWPGCGAGVDAVSDGAGERSERAAPIAVEARRAERIGDGVQRVTDQEGALQR